MNGIGFSNKSSSLTPFELHPRSLKSSALVPAPNTLPPLRRRFSGLIRLKSELIPPTKYYLLALVLA